MTGPFPFELRWLDHLNMQKTSENTFVLKTLTEFTDWPYIANCPFFRFIKFYRSLVPDTARLDSTQMDQKPQRSKHSCHQTWISHDSTDETIFIDFLKLYRCGSSKIPHAQNQTTCWRRGAIRTSSEIGEVELDPYSCELFKELLASWQIMN